MSKEKLRIATTELNNLIANLRGEVGEVIATWVTMCHFSAMVLRLSTGDPETDLANEELAFASLLEDKLSDELVGRLSELAERKIGQLTFYFASQKLGRFGKECENFERFVIKVGIRKKRNLDVSHKALPEKWTEHRYRHIGRVHLLKAICMAVRLMKRIDRKILGPAAPYFWREARKNRYEYSLKPRIKYLMMPYVRLTDEDRVSILQAELEEGFSTLSHVKTRVNGKPATVLASKKWGIVVLGNRAIPLEAYPLQELSEISFDSDPEAESDSKGTA